MNERDAARYENRGGVSRSTSRPQANLGALEPWFDKSWR
jgi:hypothetical protein